jgi:hypothetical protein
VVPRRLWPREQSASNHVLTRSLNDYLTNLPTYLPTNLPTYQPTNHIVGFIPPCTPPELVAGYFQHT